MKDVRFQNQPWYIKLWRYRWYLKIPFGTIHYRFNSDLCDREWRKAYSMAIGDAHLRMKWFYTMQEAFPRWSLKSSKWYNCAKCEALYEDQECTCNQKCSEL